MHSTSDTSNQSMTLANSGKAGVKNQEHDSEMAQGTPKKLSTAAIKQLQESHDQKHITDVNYILQITRIKDLLAAAKNGSASKNGASEKRSKQPIKFKLVSDIHFVSLFGSFTSFTWLKRD